METPAIAIAWQIWTRHRLGLKVSAAIILAMVLAYPGILRTFDSDSVFVVTTIPPVIVFAYIANLFLFADEVGNLSSGYPRRMYVLPVPARTLVLWPMLIALVALESLWLVISVLVYWRGGYHPPLVLPAVALAVLSAWLQLHCWLPLEGPVLRLFMSSMVFFVLGVPLTLLIQKNVTETTLIVSGLVLLPALYALAVVGVAHDRRGDRWTIGLEGLWRRLLSLWERLQSPGWTFRTPAEAQLWFEDRCHGSLMIALAGLQLTLIFAVSFFIRGASLIPFQFALGSMLATPLLLASSQGATLGQMHPFWVKDRGSMSFVFIRPMLSGELIVGKYRLAARIVARTWLMTLLFVAALLLMHGRQATELFMMLRQYLPGWRGIAVTATVIPVVLVLHWKLLTDSLAPALTGRRWIADGSVMAGVVFLLGTIAAVIWGATHPEAMPRVMTLLAWLAAAIVILKVLVTALAIHAAGRRGLLDMRTTALLIGLWAAAAAFTIVLTHLLLPSAGLPAPRPVILLAVLLSLPLARFALAPLALDWNRHR